MTIRFMGRLQFEQPSPSEKAMLSRGAVVALSRGGEFFLPNQSGATPYGSFSSAASRNLASLAGLAARRDRRVRLAVVQRAIDRGGA
jgi:hypothetical protein